MSAALHCGADARDRQEWVAKACSDATCAGGWVAADATAWVAQPLRCDNGVPDVL